jgi:hypothetical protein
VQVKIEKMEPVSNHPSSGVKTNAIEKKSGALNVLTILTFIGCAIQLLMAFGMGWIMGFTAKMANDPAILEKMSESEKAEMAKAASLFTIYKQYEIPLMITSIACVALCFWGALQMRKHKKQGFFAYLVGEWAPVAVSLVLMGTVMVFGSPSAIVMSVGIPALFTLLYALQLKHMR